MDVSLTDACRDFEAIVLRPMFAALKPPALPAETDEGDSSADTESADGADGTMASLFADALASAFARAGGLGIARELARALEAQ